jgi:branched-chain amino acid transport system permease protein
MTDATLAPRPGLSGPAAPQGLIAGPSFAVALALVSSAACHRLIRRGLPGPTSIFVDPFVDHGSMPDLFVQTLWEGFVGGVLYALIALGFVLIFKASGVFNFAQGIMVVFAGLTLVGVYEKFAAFGFSGMLAAYAALVVALAVMFALAVAVERVVLRPLVNQPDIILFMATFGLTYLLIGLGETIFGGNRRR